MVPKCMMFADDTTLIGESLKEINNMLKQWRSALEGKRLKMSRINTVYIEYNIGRKDQEVDDTI